MRGREVLVLTVLSLTSLAMFALLPGSSTPDSDSVVAAPDDSLSGSGGDDPSGSEDPAATPLPTEGPSPVPTATATVQSTPSATSSPEPAASGTPAPTAVATPEATGTAEPTVSTTPVATATPPPTPTPTPTPTPAPGPLPSAELRFVTYEEGEERLEFAQTRTEYGLGTTTEAARAGQASGYALLKAGDPIVSSGRRAEWSSGIYGKAGTEYSYGISYWLPTDWNQHGVGPPDAFKKRIIFQFHEGRNASWSPIFGIMIRDRGDGEQFSFYRKDGPQGPDTDLWTADIVIEQWIDFVINVKWSEEDDGFIRFFRNGELVYERFGVPTLQGRTQPYAKWGIYGEPTRILFDEVRINEGGPNLQIPTPSAG